MSMLPDQPFDEREERYFLAEILKDSLIPPGNLLRVIQAEGIQPRWTEIALPNGRSVSACQRAFDNLWTRLNPHIFQPVGPVPQMSPTSKPKKRPAPAGEISMGINRELQPRTPGFSAVNEPAEPTAYPIALADTGDQPKKKRGRPSKAEVEIKAAEYAAQGKPYPPPRKQKPPKQPFEDTGMTGSTSITFTPVTLGPSDTVVTSASKKRTPKSRVPKTERNLALEATATAAQQYQVDPIGAARISAAESSDPGKTSEALPPLLGPAERDQTVQQGPPESPQHQDEQARHIQEQPSGGKGLISGTDDNPAGVGTTTQEQPTADQEPFGTGDQDAKQD